MPLAADFINQRNPPLIFLKTWLKEPEQGLGLGRDCTGISTRCFSWGLVGVKHLQTSMKWKRDELKVAGSKFLVLQ